MLTNQLNQQRFLVLSVLIQFAKGTQRRGRTDTRHTSFSLYMGIWTSTMGNAAEPASLSCGTMGSHLYILPGRRRSSFTARLTIPRNTFSASTITDMIAHATTAALSSGTTSPLLTCSHARRSNRPASEAAAAAVPSYTRKKASPPLPAS
jgi:hypothetical protein